MSRANCRAVRLGLRLALWVALLGLAMLLPVTAWARSTVYVPAPNGVNDTANLQSALDTCVAYGKGCTVQLAAGNYLTSQLVTYNFQGTFKGTGTSKTVVEALPNLPVTVGNFLDQGPCMPNPTTCLWPSLIMFVDGDIHISDMAIKITAVPSTKSYFIGDYELTALIDAVRVMGQYRTDVAVQRVDISGMHDASSTSFFGFNVNNGVSFLGELPQSSTPFDYYFLSGNFSVTNSSFKRLGDGTGAGAFLRDSRLVVGGSPRSGNVYEDVAVGTDLESVENSVVEVSYNSVALAADTFDCVYIAPWPYRLATKPSLFLIHDNTFKPMGTYTDGIFLWDDPVNQWIYALISNNTIEAQDAGGIDAYSTKATTIVNNKLSGNGTDAIGIWGGTYATVLSNDVAGFTASPDLAQIVLDGTTTHSTVLCKSSNDTVMNLGTNNKLIGCQQGGNSARTSKMSSQPRVLRSKPTRR